MVSSQTCKYNKYALTLLRYSFVIAGVFLNESRRKYEKLYAAGFTVFVVSGGSAIFVLFNQVTSVGGKFEVIYALFGATCVQLVFTTFQLNKGKLRKIYFWIEKMYEIDQFEAISNRICVKIISEVIPYVIFMVVTTFMVPVLIAAATDVPLGEFSTLIIPSWYPWSRTTITGYVFTITAQVFTMLIAYSLLTSSVVVFATAVMVIYSYNEILSRKLSGMKIHWFGVRKDESWDEEMKELIKHYQQLMNNEVIRLAANFTSVLLYTIIGEVVALISVFLFMQVENDYYLGKLKLLSACSIMNWTFISYCIGGEVLKSLKDDINYALYDTPWYCQDTKRRKIILIFMILNQNPLTLKAFNTYSYNLFFMLSFVKVCYSVVQFLKTAVL